MVTKETKDHKRQLESAKLSSSTKKETRQSEKRKQKSKKNTQSEPSDGKIYIKLEKTHDILKTISKKSRVLEKKEIKKSLS